MKRCHCQTLLCYLVFFVTEVTYFGHLLTSEGLKPDPAKVAAVKDMAAPSSKAKLQTMMGIFSYMSKFAENLSAVTSHLRELLAKHVEFEWTQRQQNALYQVKKILTEPGKLLAYYDPKKDLTLQTDSSRQGVGATLLQDGRPLAYASKSLTPSEKNYTGYIFRMFWYPF